MAGRFDYVKYDDRATAISKDFKEHVSKIEETIIKELGHGVATARAIQHLEECYMWIGKAIRDDQVIRNLAEETEMKAAAAEPIADLGATEGIN